MIGRATGRMRAVAISLFDNGYGIKPNTYFKLLYPIYSGDEDYYVLHTAIFGLN